MSATDSTEETRPRKESRDSYLTLDTHINLKWVTNLNIKAKILKPSEEKIGENLCEQET